MHISKIIQRIQQMLKIIMYKVILFKKTEPVFTGL